MLQNKNFQNVQIDFLLKSKRKFSLMKSFNSIQLQNKYVQEFYSILMEISSHMSQQLWWAGLHFFLTTFQTDISIVVNTDFKNYNNNKTITKVKSSISYLLYIHTSVCRSSKRPFLHFSSKPESFNYFYHSHNSIPVELLNNHNPSTDKHTNTHTQIKFNHDKARKEETKDKIYKNL